MSCPGLARHPPHLGRFCAGCLHGRPPAGLFSVVYRSVAVCHRLCIGVGVGGIAAAAYSLEGSLGYLIRTVDVGVPPVCLLIAVLGSPRDRTVRDTFESVCQVLVGFLKESRGLEVGCGDVSELSVGFGLDESRVRFFPPGGYVSRSLYGRVAGDKEILKDMIGAGE